MTLGDTVGGRGGGDEAGEALGVADRGVDRGVAVGGEARTMAGLQGNLVAMLHVGDEEDVAHLFDILSTLRGGTSCEDDDGVPVGMDEGDEIGGDGGVVQMWERE